MRRLLCIGLMSAIGLGLSCFTYSGVHAESKIVERKKIDKPPLETAADALGMERGVRRELTAINAIYFIANGTLQDAANPALNPKVSRAVFSMSYYLPAIRIDVTRRGGNGKPRRDIRVAHGKLAWNETEPGVGAEPADDSAAARLLQAWVTPHGAIRAMVDARAKNPQAVTASNATLSMEFQGAPFVVDLNSDHRPQRLHWIQDGKQIEVEYLKYKDWELLDVYFPQRIVQRVDGKVVADLTITEYRTNPYVVFPIPAPVRNRGT